jgi:hypothetical protein
MAMIKIARGMGQGRVDSALVGVTYTGRARPGGTITVPDHVPVARLKKLHGIGKFLGSPASPSKS